MVNDRPTSSIQLFQLYWRIIPRWSPYVPRFSRPPSLVQHRLTECYHFKHVAQSLLAVQMFGIVDMWLAAVVRVEKAWRWPKVVKWISRFFCFAFIVSQTVGDILRPIYRRAGNLVVFRILATQNFVIIAICGLVAALGFLVAGSVIKRRLAQFEQTKGSKRARVASTVRIHPSTRRFDHNIDRRYCFFFTRRSRTG